MLPCAGFADPPAWNADGPLQQSALVHEDQMICDFAGKSDFMRDHDHSDAAACQVLDDIQHLADKLRVESGGWLVEEHNLRFHGKRAGDRHTLLLTA